jgi:hypothetical protein
MNNRDELANRFNRDEEVHQAVSDAVRDALEEHARKGNHVVVWKDGKAVWVPATGETE